MSKDYCNGCQERHYNDDMDNLYLCDACTTILYQSDGKIERLTTALEQYRSDLAERDKVARDRLKRIEQLEVVFQRIADSGIENNFAWAWIGGIAKQILQTAGDSAPKDTRPYKERFPEQYCLNCGQWLGGGAACCGDPKSPTAKVIETVPDKGKDDV